MSDRIKSNYFNPRSREGSDLAPITTTLTSNLFQSTLPRGERHRPTDTINQRISISIHAPARGATWDRAFHESEYIFQSTLPRGERQQPAREAAPEENFNPRSREGSDPAGFAAGRFIINFNPRSREGSDKTQGIIDRRFKISIHAPARGTTKDLHLKGLLWLFQSTLPRGERRLWVNYSLKSCSFQSTLPRGERLIRKSIASQPTTFQSTLPRGERLLHPLQSDKSFFISIHAPARGATSLPL